MATTESSFLSAVKTAVLAMSPASPAVDTSRVYVTPDDYGSVTANVPFVIINRQQEPFTIEANDARWNLEIFVFLHSGELLYPSADYAAMELKARQWLKVIIEWVRDNKRPMSTYGKPAGDMTADIVALQFNQKPYNGLYVSLPVIQFL